MFHLQLRHFPHNHCQFNLTEQELLAVISPWARGEWVDLGERRWSPHQAKITIVEGPPVALQQLSMGRGWRHAQRNGHDVTERLLESVAQRSRADAVVRSPATAAPRACHQAGAAVGSSDAVQGDVRLLLGGGDAAEVLLALWQSAAAQNPQRSPSECLALAEQKLYAAARQSSRGASGGG